jgi:Predicted pPIWI-associating nuclease
VLTLHELKLWVLREVAATSQPVHKFNLIGRNGMGGPLEWQFGRAITPEERALAVRAFDELKAADLIRPTYADLSEPENWVTITDKGKQALEKGALDQLDQILMSISPHLLEVRRGAWSALASSQPDSFRQAAHSARELIDQVLKEGAPDATVMADSEFAGHNRKADVTRKDRLKFLMRKFRGEVSESDVGIADKTIELVLEIDRKLIALAHARSSPQRRDVEDCVQLAESALRRVLVAAP